MTPLQAALVALAGVAAGTINTLAGAGTLITFPTLLALGVPPVVANVSNTIGLVPGSVSGAIGYRSELSGQLARLTRLSAASLGGGVAGGLLLLRLPPSAFRAVVPVLIAVACALVVLKPRIQNLVQRPHDAPPHGALWVWLAVLAVGVYGGYFGAAQGVMLIGVLGIGLNDTYPRVNAAKNVLAALTNGVAALLFMVAAHPNWTVALLIAGGSVVGGQIGSFVGRRLPEPVLRGFIVVMGAVAIVRLLA